MRNYAIIKFITERALRASQDVVYHRARCEYWKRKNYNYALYHDKYAAECEVAVLKTAERLVGILEEPEL